MLDSRRADRPAASPHGAAPGALRAERCRRPGRVHGADGRSCWWGPTCRGRSRWLLSYTGALVVHFTLNRQFVFAPSDGYAHGLSSHGKRYVLAAIVVYGVTALGLRRGARGAGRGAVSWAGP